jgi:signal transduction histidine kinase
MMALHDFDSSDRAHRSEAFGWSLAGLLIGALFGVLLVLVSGAAPLRTILVSAGAMWALAYFGARRFAGHAAGIGGSIYFSGGSKLPVRREFSLAESYVARGMLQAAEEEFKRAASRFEADPEPCLRLARLLRDAPGRQEEAITWFRRAAARAGGDRGLASGITRELIEIYTHRLRTPERALADLARLAAENPDTPVAQWARRELDEIGRTQPNPAQDG